MLYLAETQRKSGFIGNGKAEFKLLACQRSEHDWSAVPGDEVVAAPDDADYGADTLVLIELNSSRQVQRHQAAGRTLVNILQNFSGLSKKFKAQGEEIEQWKESLTYQSQALNRREMEIESRQDQVEQAEADLEQLEERQQAVEAQQSEVEALKEDLTRKNSELEGAWAHLNGEIQKFEERQAEAQGGLSDEQTCNIQNAIARLGEVTLSATTANGDLTAAFELVTHYQNEVAENQQRLAQKQSEVEAEKAALSDGQKTLSEAKQSLHEAESTLCTTQVTLQQQQALQEAKQAQNQLLTEQLENQSNLHQHLYKLLNAADKVKLSKKVDVTALEAMTVDDLQTLVAKLETDLNKMSGFVNDQEEELRLQQEDIDVIQAKIEGANEYDRLQLETEIEEEKDRHVMLNRTLVGQRRNLLEREEILEQHRAVLLRKQGLAAEGSAGAAELEPLLDEIDALRARLGEQIQQVETESAQIQTEIEALKQTRQQQQEIVASHQQLVSTAEENCFSHQITMGQAEGQVTLYETLLPIIEERLGGFYLKLEAVSQVLEQLQVAEASQQNAVQELQGLVNSLNVPEPALV
ncbi:MAG: pilus motility taxis protein HmpF [Cyanobacteria bacterium P01_D01_bin.105]